MMTTTTAHYQARKCNSISQSCQYVWVGPNLRSSEGTELCTGCWLCISWIKKSFQQTIIGAMSEPANQNQKPSQHSTGSLLLVETHPARTPKEVTSRPRIGAWTRGNIQKAYFPKNNEQRWLSTKELVQITGWYTSNYRDATLKKQRVFHICDIKNMKVASRKTYVWQKSQRSNCERQGMQYFLNDMSTLFQTESWWRTLAKRLSCESENSVWISHLPQSH